MCIRDSFIGDASDPNTSNIVINYASSIFRDYQNELTEQKKLPYTIETETRMLYLSLIHI